MKIDTEMLIRVRNFVHLYALGRSRLESVPEEGNITILIHNHPISFVRWAVFCSLDGLTN